MLRWFLAITLLPTLAVANGGPVDWTGRTAKGGLSPVQQTGVRLVRENLEIRLRGDGNSFDVRATYELDNPGPQTEVLFGVPFRAVDGVNSYWGTPRWQAEARWRQAASVEIELDGVHRCKLRERPSEVAPPAPDPALVPDLDEDTDEPVMRWCTAKLSIPAGRSSLRLSYRGELFYEDWVTSKSPETSYGPRTLWYPFRPAGFWKGPTARLDVTVRLGPFASMAHEVELLHDGKATPPAHRGRELTWSFENIDLKSLGDLRVAITSNRMSAKERASWNGAPSRDQKKYMKARASSTLTPGKKFSFGAEKVVDGDGTTAWCEGTQGTGVGEWVEITAPFPFAVPDEDGEVYCWFRGMVVVPGYASSQKTYRANGRVKAFRISPCAKPEAGKPTRIKRIRRRYDLAPVFIWPDEFDEGEIPPHPASQGYDVPMADTEAMTSECFRLTIVEVEPGDQFEDTCISEIAPVYNCL